MNALTRPPHWEPFYVVRESGQIPRRGFVRVALDSGLTLGTAMEVPEDVNPWTLDFSPLAALDAFVIFDGERTSYWRLTNCVGAILRSNPASLHLIDAPIGYAPRWAHLKWGYPRRGYAHG